MRSWNFVHNWENEDKEKARPHTGYKCSLKARRVQEPGKSKTRCYLQMFENEREPYKSMRERKKDKAKNTPKKF